MSKERPFEDIKPIAKINTATASREELISYIERLEGDLKSMNDTILCWIAKDKAQENESVDISKLRLMTVEECAGHTIDYAMGWKACIEWIKKGCVPE